MIETFKKSTVVKLSENFKSTEFDCKSQNCCSVTKIDSELVDILQKIRDHFKSPVDITSGYRCSEHNEKVGGSKSSRHKTGEAADIVVRNVEPIQVAKYAESIGVRGIGLYDGFVHIDTRKKQSFWYSEAEEYRATFGGENLIKQWQKAAQKDGFTFKSGADGIWGKECEAVAKKAVLKKRLTYKYKNLTAFVQKLLKIDADSKFGAKTKAAVIAYQSENGLVLDGAVGVNTYKKLLGVD